MAIKHITQVVCDRCEKVVEGAVNETSNKNPLATLVVAGTLLADGTQIRFDDLCPKCIARVQALLANIRLDSAKIDDASPDDGDNTGTPGTAAKRAPIIKT